MLIKIYFLTWMCLLLIEINEVTSTRISLQIENSCNQISWTQTRNVRTLSQDRCTVNSNSLPFNSPIVQHFIPVYNILSSTQIHISIIR
jgi:hypothetical protein